MADNSFEEMMKEVGETDPKFASLFQTNSPTDPDKIPQESPQGNITMPSFLHEDDDDDDSEETMGGAPPFFILTVIGNSLSMQGAMNKSMILEALNHAAETIMKDDE